MKVKMINSKTRKVFEILLKEEYLPKEGEFEITDILISKSFEIWNELYHPNYNKKLRPSQIRFGKKIAGINLVKLLMERRQNKQTIKESKNKNGINCGFVYIITNSAFPGYYKIGMTLDLDNRLKSYQTYDPLKRFKVEHYSFVSNKREVEKNILEKFKLNISTGEWITNEDVRNEILKL